MTFQGTKDPRVHLRSTWFMPPKNIFEYRREKCFTPRKYFTPSKNISYRREKYCIPPINVLYRRKIFYTAEKSFADRLVPSIPAGAMHMVPRLTSVRRSFCLFGVLSDRFRTVSDDFGLISDRFRSVSDGFGRFRIVFGQFRAV